MYIICSQSFYLLSQSNIDFKQTPKRKRKSAPVEPIDPEEVQNEVLLKIARNVITYLGLGVSEKKERFLALKNEQKKAVKAVQVLTCITRF